MRRLDVLEVVVAEAQLRRLVAAQVREDGVDRRDEVLEHRARGGCRRSSETLRLLRLKDSKKSESSPSWYGGT